MALARWTCAGRFPARQRQSETPPGQRLAQVALLGAGAGVWAAGILRRRAARRGPRPRAADDGPRRNPPWGAVGAAVLVAATTWLLNGTWSRPVWETLPLLASVQFAWRLWGPFSLAVASRRRVAVRRRSPGAR